MATVPALGKSSAPREDEDGKERNTREERKNEMMMSSLRKEEGWHEEYMYEYQGFWYSSVIVLEGTMWMQQNLKPRREDILLVTLPKSGTTWFKPLMFAVMNRTRFDLTKQTILTTSPHDIVPFSELYRHQNIPFPDPDAPHPPRLFQAHTPFTSLSQYVMQSQCRIVYVCRNPKDVFVSTFFFAEQIRYYKKLPPLSLDKAFELFCKGVSLCGPFWDHVLGYWKASLEMPERVMFIKYEDMKRDPLFHLKRLAEFMGYPFSAQEEEQGVVHDILDLCSFENLRNLEVNITRERTSRSIFSIKNVFFRKGEVGDWKKHLTDEMVDSLNNLIEEKFAGSGLIFHDSSSSSSPSSA